MTRIIIAHRPETIRSADRIIVLDSGRIVLDERTKRGKAMTTTASSEYSDLLRLLAALSGGNEIQLHAD